MWSRWALALVLVLVFLLMPIAPGAVAQPGPERLSITDPPGDVMLRAFVSQVDPVPIRYVGDQYDNVDLLEAWIGPDTLEHVEVGFKVKRLESVGTLDYGTVGRYVSMNWQIRDRVYQLDHDYVACIRVQIREGQNLRQVACAKASTEPSQGIVRYLLPRSILTDSSRAPLQKGDAIEGFRVEARSLNVVSSVTSGSELRYGVLVNDTAPDKAPASPFIVQTGLPDSVGSVRIFATEPVRASNGESTTIVYKIQAQNRGTEERTIHLSAASTEEEFQLRVPPRIVVPAKGEITFPAILSMGFTHRHGEVGNFTVVASDPTSQDPPVELRLGVYWLETPQPAGHHNVLYLHSKPAAGGTGQTRAWINPLEKDPDPDATDAPLGSQTLHSDPPNSRMKWDLPLQPPLQIGLDFDINQTVKLETKFQGKLGGQQAQVYASIEYCRPRGAAATSAVACNRHWQPLADGNATINLGSSPTPVTMELKLKPLADFLPFTPGSNLQLHLELTTLGAESIHSQLVPKDSKITLPLIEYHDPIAQEFQTSDHLVLHHLGPLDRNANPGDTLIFKIRLENKGSRGDEVLLSLEGHNADWASLPRGDRVRLEPAGSIEVPVAVTVPSDAADGERAELFVVAQSLSHPNTVTLARLRTNVIGMDVRDIPDEQSLLEAQPQKKSNAASALLSCTVVAAMVLVLRRRRS